MFGSTVGFVVCVGSVRFDSAVKVVGACFVGLLWTIVVFGVVLIVDEGRGFVCNVLLTVFDAVLWVVVFGTAVVFAAVIFGGAVVF